MTDQELRLECLRLASKDADKFTKPDSIVSAANEFFQFLLFGVQKQEQEQHRTDQQSKEGHHDETCLTEQKQLVVVALTPELHALLSQVQG